MIYVTGDMHGQFSRLTHAPLTAEDTLLVCGDFGFACGTDADSDIGLAWLASRPYTVLFIDGNHDNLPWLSALPVEQRFGGTVGRVRENIFHLRRGQLYEIGGHTFFVMGGASSTDQAYRRQAGLPWWEQELPSPDELEQAVRVLDSVDWQVDGVLTHTAPREAIYALGGHPYPPERPLTEFLDRLYHELTYAGWFFGHWHTDRRISDRMFAVHELLIPISE